DLLPPPDLLGVQRGPCVQTGKQRADVVHADDDPVPRANHALDPVYITPDAMRATDDERPHRLSSESGITEPSRRIMSASDTPSRNRSARPGPRISFCVALLWPRSQPS